MSGKAKKWLAILAALGITSSGVVAYLHYLAGAFPNVHWLQIACTTVAGGIGLLTTYYNISIKNPDPNAGKLPAPPEPDARTKQ